MSFEEALNSINVDSSFENRKLIAEKNEILDYTASELQDNELLEKLKKGILIKVNPSTDKEI